jgi:hypothetical protein
MLCFRANRLAESSVANTRLFFLYGVFFQPRKSRSPQTIEQKPATRITIKATKRAVAVRKIKSPAHNFFTMTVYPAE